MAWLLEHEPVVRLTAFFGVFLAMAAWEILAGRRPLKQSKRRRWRDNLGIVVLDTVLVRVLVPTAAVGAAVAAQTQGWGLLHAVPVPGWLAVILGVVLLDLAIYTQHVVFHHVPVLWRLHAMHHADVDFDVTTALRFHPIEILLSMGIKLAVVVALGVPPVAVLLFEVILNAAAMFNHGNVRLARGVDRVLRTVIVTPDMHRVHHADIPAETHSNFGFNLSVWDRLFGSYVDQPTGGHTGMRIGLPDVPDAVDQTLPWMLAFPFRSRTPARDEAQPAS